MDEKLIKELKERFMKNFPIEFTAIRPMEKQYKSLEEYHKYSVNHGKDAFLFHRRNEQELPALFFIPYERKTVSSRGHSFIEMAKRADVLNDPKPKSPFAEMVIGCKFSSDLSKNLAVTVISGMLDDFNAPYYTFITEAYSLKMDKDEDINLAPSEHPKRKEIMMIHTCDQIKTLGTHIDIVDNDLGKEEHHKDMGDDRRGRFSNLFKEIQSPSQTN
tara:strand:- start:320 stop:970 length:651 start_codon:yes stop_codon:yes gene_type:complete